MLAATLTGRSAKSLSANLNGKIFTLHTEEYVPIFSSGDSAASATGFYLYCKTGTLSGNKCVKKTYTNLCPSGFTLTKDKSKCERGYLVPNTVSARVKYTCSTGTLSGTKCITTSTVASTASTKYSCASGSTLTNKNQCERVVDVYSDVTYYRYKTYTTTKDTVVYKWSKSNNDTSLLKAGYKLTGKTKVSK